MFKLKAEYREEFEVKSGLATAHAFFSDTDNFVRLMPGVEEISTLPDGSKRWIIRSEVPVVGSIPVKFQVRQTDDQSDRIEWSPIGGEKKNFLKYSISFEDKGQSLTVHVDQRVELRRENASEFHALAGWIGESRLSAEMEKMLSGMMRTFLQKAREVLG
jgi:carbon monoxide dehydrogenase subunit G